MPNTPPAEESEEDSVGMREARERIEDARRRRSTLLDLSGLMLTSLPETLENLPALRVLSLANNQLTSVPEALGEMSRLLRLYLSDNRLTNLPETLWQLKSLRELRLNSNQFASVPEALGQLESLLLLDLSDNQITSVPKVLGELKSLQKLSLSGNQLMSVPEALFQLTALKELDLAYNQLKSVPEALEKLAEMQRLVLSGNQLKSVPEALGKLPALRLLYLSNNRLTSLPKALKSLTALEGLWLSSNQFKNVPDALAQLLALRELSLVHNQLASIPEWLGDLPKLKLLFLHDNPALGISPSVLGPDPRQPPSIKWSSPKAILDFYFGRREGKTRPLNEVKLILVGRGGAGKTCTVRALQDMPFRDGEDSTPGIALCDWKMAGCKGQPVTAHIWDFAGQVITHALHQFFFSVRSVYVVVLTGRENNERDDAEYWLRLIKAFGTDDAGNGPPVIIALNKWDVPGCRPRVDHGALQEKYPFIRGFVEMDCKSKKGIPKLKAALCREVSRMKWVREPFPEAWDGVRRALANGRKKQPHLTYAKFRALCVKHRVTDEGKQDSLAEILHNLGAALNYRNDPRLREATVLQPEWLTKNVYGLVRRAEKQSGVLKQTDVDSVLRAEKDKAMRAYLVQIMERFEIAYAPRAATTGVWLVPQALPDNQPTGVDSFRDATDATRLRYTYQALPEGLVARAIVRLHEFIEEAKGKKQQWASGAILAREGARALLRAESKTEVMVVVTGPKKARQQLAGLCQAEMRDIHGEIRGLDPTEETQVEGAWVATKTLKLDEDEGRKTGVSTNDRGTVMVDPKEPNNAYSVALARLDQIWKPTVFISYSKSNVSQRKRLESELKILKNEGLLAEHWHDRMIDPGDEWDTKIQQELSEADVIIVLASSAALSTDYITTHEIPKALELHNGGKAVVVPVVLEACRWDKTALGALNALPEKGKALNKWKPIADGWKSVADGLATVFKKLMTKGDKAERTAFLVTRRAV